MTQPGGLTSHHGSGELTLPAEPSTPRAARHFLAERLDRLQVTSSAVDLALLLTSELVTNAVRYGRGLVTLSVRTEPPSVRVVVHDGNPDLPTMGPDDETAEGGRGLRLVDTLATRWGAETGDEGKDVWFELDLRGR
ncbi:ATP-binding protein [Aquipuribacter hungaricus]|uniref:ATP-binding protein n=1 Tax=Aquipuribacter hungaricus TaxID=545624 RepID=A0ABV7WLU1_9MICO